MIFANKIAPLGSLVLVLITISTTALNAAGSIATTRIASSRTTPAAASRIPGRPPLPPQTVTRLKLEAREKEAAFFRILEERLRSASMYSPDAVAFLTHSAQPTPCFNYTSVVCEKLPGVAEDQRLEIYEPEAAALAAACEAEAAALAAACEAEAAALAALEKISPEEYALITDEIINAFMMRVKEPFKTIITSDGTPIFIHYEPFMTNNTYGSEPLIVACTHHSTNYNTVAVQRLLKNGANPNLLSIKGKTVLTEACKRGNKELVIALLKTKNSPLIYQYPVNVNRPDKAGKTPLAAAIEYFHYFYMQPLFPKQLETATAIIKALVIAGAIITPELNELATLALSIAETTGTITAAPCAESCAGSGAGTGTGAGTGAEELMRQAYLRRK